MAKLKCRHCGAIVKRDLRLNISKMFIHMELDGHIGLIYGDSKNKGYLSWCEKTGKSTFLTKVK